MSRPNLAVCGLVSALTCIPDASIAADTFAPVGAKATLSVEYSFESAGTQGGSTPANPHTWRVKRSASITNTLVAQAGLPLANIQTNDAAALGRQDELAGRAAAIARNNQPAVDMVKAVEACGDNDMACFMREAQKMSGAMQGPQNQARRDAIAKDSRAAGDAMVPRFQAWHASTQTGRYEVDETHRITEFRAPCRPMTQCTYQVVRQGAGAVPLPGEAKTDIRQIAGYVGVEFDTAKNTLTLKLPVPGVVPTTETVTGTADGGKTVNKPLHIRAGARDAASIERLVTVPVKGDWRQQSGELTEAIPGRFGEGGTLTVRWRLNVL